MKVKRYRPLQGASTLSQKFFTTTHPSFDALCFFKISPCLMDNVVDFGREKFSENLDQISYGIFCYRALGFI
ncbi:unknown protein [Simkania negevensis Z]|uniref:Uncharacterized protein n=1 Tax=Simkania negevensis (strain ATCC VR-1471 / DSM 27360 / Z) TaxID=331113 RepID=F8L6F0_SIMNZ|nr:unknown protein [Simkania negevensis Z]